MTQQNSTLFDIHRQFLTQNLTFSASYYQPCNSYEREFIEQKQCYEIFVLLLQITETIP